MDDQLYEINATLAMAREQAQRLAEVLPQHSGPVQIFVNSLTHIQSQFAGRLTGELPKPNLHEIIIAVATANAFAEFMAENNPEHAPALEQFTERINMAQRELVSAIVPRYDP